jgi:hypothetical protein
VVGVAASTGDRLIRGSSEHRRDGGLTGRLLRVLRRQPTGWVVLYLVMAALAVMVSLDAAWQVARGARWPLAVAPVNLVLCYWIGVGAWRRTTESSATA